MALTYSDISNPLSEFQNLKWHEIHSLESPTTEQRRYKDSAEAYRALHDALSWAVDAMLEDCDYKKAIEYCELMRDIEGHTYVG